MESQQVGVVSAINGVDTPKFFNGLFGVDLEEGWVQSNPFTDLMKRVKGRCNKKEMVLLDQADIERTYLPRHY